MDGTGKSITVNGNYRRTARGQAVILLVILCGSALLLLKNLGNIYLWQDEAQTALVSKTILTDGVPRGCDGKNYFSQELGAEYGKNYIWRWHTWLPFYVLAAFYKVFGIGTFVSRLPFALFGLATIAATYYFAKEYWPGTNIPVIASALLALCVPFLLMCRQCRYYSMVMCFTVLAMFAYAALLNGRKYAATALFITSTLLFHSMYFYVPMLFAALLLHTCIFRRDKIKLLLLVAVAVAIVNCPWVIWLSSVNFPTINKKMVLNVAMAMKFVMEYCLNIFKFVIPAWLLLILIVTVIERQFGKNKRLVKDERFWEKITLPAFFISFNIFAMSVTAPAPFFRYLAPCLPMLLILAAVVINAAFQVHLLLGIIAVILMLVTGQLKDYFYEITHDYDGPEEGIISYLNQNGSPQDVVAITYGDMSLKFYTKMRVIGGLTGEYLDDALNARWLIIRRHIICEKDAAVRNYLKRNINWSDYRPVVIDYPDIPFENREEPKNHLFRTAQTEDKVVIYQRIKK